MRCPGVNYVSDVDVLFVVSRADSDGAPLVSNDQAVQIATRMADKMTRVCSAHTAAGTIWELDAALRPEGKAGGAGAYPVQPSDLLQKWAKTWEFQAMLKARPAAGDLELGQAFVDLVAPMVWRAAERENFVADTQAMRKRVVATFRPAIRVVSSSWGRAACATSSSRSSCCSWCMAGWTSDCGRAQPCQR